MRILVCGGRDFYKYSLLYATLEKLLDDVWQEDEDEPITIIQGGASGADFLAKVFALDEMAWLLVPRVLHEEYKADWKKYGKGAGHIRNQEMLDVGKPDIVVAFPGGVGTKDMVTRAKNAGIKVLELT
jgi:predicted Rossmann-fold nucleotide-binding protein